MEFIPFQNVHQMLKETVERCSDLPAYRWFVSADQKKSITWAEHYEKVKKASKSLLALGVQLDQKVNVLSYSRYEWALADHAIMTVGAVTVGIYQSNLPKDCQYIIDHCDAVFIFVENELQLKKVLEVRDQIPKVKKVITFDETGYSNDDWVITFDEFLKLGESVTDQELTLRIDEVQPEHLAGIVYTSGTTGVPKGAMLTHDNFIFTAQSVKISLDIQGADDTFLFLPLAHVFARITAMGSLLAGVPTTFTRSMDRIVEDMKAASPTWFASVPRIYEKVYSKVLSGVEAKGGLSLKIFRWAVKVGEQVSDHLQAKKAIPGLLNLQYKLATKLVFGKIQAALGGNIRWCISGAAPLNAEIAKFFHAAGILILEGIGMTENTSFSHLNRVDNFRFGWVGLPGPGIEAKIAEDGEFMTRGRNTMKGYYKMPEETAETITEDGWLKTGDLGEIDAEGFLRITGRKKDLIITAGGKNIAPSAIEGVLATSKYINQVCVIGDRRKFLSALVTLDEENIKDFSREKGIPFDSLNDLIGNETIKALIDQEVQEKNKAFARYETIKKVVLVPEFTIENGLLTPTLKIKKNRVLNSFAEKIDQMYPDS